MGERHEQGLQVMSIDTTFKPLGNTYAVDNSAAVQIPNAGMQGITTFRIRNLSTSAAVYVAWGRTAPAAPAAPALGAPIANAIGISPGGTLYLEVPANSFFIASTALAGPGGVEITGGIGGVGG
jgi:hypothetical protein